jgi:hypothetical protein
MDGDATTGIPLRVVVFVVVAFALLAGVVGFGLGRGSVNARNAPAPLPAARPPSQLGVPDVVGEPLEVAGDRLIGLGFDIGFRQPPSGEGTGTVMTTVPDAGEIVERGSLVVLVEGRRG